MTNEQILRKSIEKTVKNGWENKYKFTDKSWHYLLEGKNYYKIIFSHDFAKSYFPGRWKEHLQEMVLYGNPLEYIEKFL